MNFSLVYRMWYTVRVRKKPESLQRGDVQSDRPDNEGKRIPAIFYRTEAGGEPVREWLKEFPQEDRRRIGEDIKTVEFGWPVGMQAARPQHLRSANEPCPEPNCKGALLCR